MTVLSTVCLQLSGEIRNATNEALTVRLNAHVLGSYFRFSSYDLFFTGRCDKYDPDKLAEPKQVNSYCLEFELKADQLNTALNSVSWL